MKKLERSEMKALKGGIAEPASGKCFYKYSYHPNIPPDIGYITRTGTCSQQISQANDYCVGLLQVMGLSSDSCNYDCECDGLSAPWLPVSYA